MNFFASFVFVYFMSPSTHHDISSQLSALQGLVAVDATLED